MQRHIAQLQFVLHLRQNTIGIRGLIIEGHKDSVRRLQYLHGTSRLSIAEFAAVVACAFATQALCGREGASEVG